MHPTTNSHIGTPQTICTAKLQNIFIFCKKFTPYGDKGFFCVHKFVNLKDYHYPCNVKLLI